MKRLTAMVIALALLAGCHAAAPEPTPASSPPPAPSAAVQPTPEPRLSLEEQVGQLFLAGFDGLTAEEAAGLLSEYHVGGVLLDGRNVESAEQLLSLTNGLKAANESPLPLFLAAEQEGGSWDLMPPEVHRLPDLYSMRPMEGKPYLNTASTFGKALGAECAAFGVNFILGPVVNACADPADSYLGTRSFGTENLANMCDRVLGGVWSASYDEETGTAGILSALKYFPALGDPAADPRETFPVVDLDFGGRPWSEAVYEWQWPLTAAQHDFWIVFCLWDTYEPPLVTGHVLIPSLDPDRPASLSPAVFTALDTTSYCPLAVADDLNVPSILERYDIGEAAVMAVEAGNDLLMVSAGDDALPTAYHAVLEAVRSGRITQARLDASLERIRAAKEELYHLSDDALPPPDLDALNAQIDAILTG